MAEKWKSNLEKTDDPIWWFDDPRIDEVRKRMTSEKQINAVCEWSFVWTQYSGKSYYYHLHGIEHDVISHPSAKPFFPWLKDEHFFTYEGDPIFNRYFGINQGRTKNPPLDLNVFLKEINPYIQFGPEWMIPPYKEIYSRNNPIVAGEKPVIILNNKYNLEFYPPKPINFFSYEFMDLFCKKFKDMYDIWYIRHNKGNASDYTDDRHPPIDNNYNDYQIMANKHKCKTLYDFQEETGLPYNVVQMHMLAKAKYIVTLNGGNGCLSSYFGDEVWQWGNPDGPFSDLPAFRSLGWYNMLNPNGRVYGTTDWKTMLAIIEHDWVTKNKKYKPPEKKKTVFIKDMPHLV